MDISPLHTLTQSYYEPFTLGGQGSTSGVNTITSTTLGRTKVGEPMGRKAISVKCDEYHVPISNLFSKSILCSRKEKGTVAVSLRQRKNHTNSQ
jgi:hypothetical protein